MRASVYPYLLFICARLFSQPYPNPYCEVGDWFQLPNRSVAVDKDPSGGRYGQLFDVIALVVQVVNAKIQTWIHFSKSIKMAKWFEALEGKNQAGYITLFPYLTQTHPKHNHKVLNLWQWINSGICLEVNQTNEIEKARKCWRLTIYKKFKF